MLLFMQSALANSKDLHRHKFNPPIENILALLGIAFYAQVNAMKIKLIFLFFRVHHDRAICFAEK